MARQIARHSGVKAWMCHRTSLLKPHPIASNRPKDPDGPAEPFGGRYSSEIGDLATTAGCSQVEVKPLALGSLSQAQPRQANPVK
jgi:hypothetical protein